MKRSQIEKLSIDELKQLCNDYGIKIDSQCKEKLITLLCGEAEKPVNKPAPTPVQEKPVNPVAPVRGNTQIVTELEKQVKDLLARVNELEKFDVRKISARKAELTSRKNELETELSGINEQLQELDSLTVL